MVHTYMYVHMVHYICICCSIVNPDQWEAFSVANTRRAEQEIASSTRLREAINHTVQQVRGTAYNVCIM